jgi:hypothetical protein
LELAEADDRSAAVATHPGRHALMMAERVIPVWEPMGERSAVSVDARG